MSNCYCSKLHPKEHTMAWSTERRLHTNKYEMRHSTAKTKHPENYSYADESHIRVLAEQLKVGR